MVINEMDGSLTFRTYVPRARSVELVGDFTSWVARPVPLEREQCEDRSGQNDFGQRQPSGWWRTRARIPDGDHSFSYLIDNHWWLPDYAAHGVRRNLDGNWTSLLFVPPRPRIVHPAPARHQESDARGTRPAAAPIRI